MVNGTRVVVTGTGAITSLGHTTRETWEAVKAGRSGIRRVSAFDPSATPSQVASEVVDFKPETRLDRKEARRMSRFVQFAMVATKEALQESGLHITEANRDQVGVIVGSAIGADDDRGYGRRPDLHLARSPWTELLHGLGLRLGRARHRRGIRDHQTRGRDGDDRRRQ